MTDFLPDQPAASVEPAADCLQRLPAGVRIAAGQLYLWLLPLAPARIRVVCSLQPALSDRPSLILTEQPAFTDWALTVDHGQVRLQTDALIISVCRTTLQVSFHDCSGRLLFREAAHRPKEMAPVDVLRTRAAAAGQLQMAVTVDGLRVKAQDMVTYVDRQAAQARLFFDFQPQEALYGLGSHEEGVANLRGTHQYIYQQNMKACVPVLVSSRGYGVLFNCCSLMTFRDDFQGSYLWMETVEQLDYVFYCGPTLQTLIGHYYALTGKPPLLPRWSFGYIQSKERYIDAAELIAVTAEHRQRQIPLDCIVLDWRSWAGDLWGEKVFDTSRFPDPHGMVDQLHALKARLMISIWPNMAPGGTHFAQMIERGLMLGNQSTYDAFNPAARRLYWQQAADGLFASGLDAWWCDCTEPFEGDWKGSIKPEPEERIRLNCDEARRYLDPALINAYSLVHSQGIYEGQRQLTNSKRVINLTRSAYAGQHRYATVTWSGDTAASWAMFKKQIPAATHFCATGEPYWTYDIGAFFVKKREQWFWSGEFDQGCADPAYREFYLRMFQCGAFLPMFRSHGTDTPREAWRFGKPGESVYEGLVRFIRLRYRLLPYLYSLAGQAALAGQFLLAPPGLVFPDDPQTHDLGQAFLFGPSVLVWPVTDPLDAADARRSRVYLPRDCDWYDFWTHQLYSGGQWLEQPVELATIPVFVRAGSILPLADAGQVADALCSDDITLDRLDILVYPGADAAFDLYEDAGDGYGYEQGEYALTRLVWSEAEQLLTTSICGSYPGFNPDKTLRLQIISGG